MKLSASDWFGVVLIGAFVLSGLLHFPFIVGPLLGSFLAWVAFGKLRDRHLLRTRGWLVTPEGRDCFSYREVDGGSIRALRIDGEMGVRAPHELYIPSELEWSTKAPEWARERREEIIERVRQDLRPPRFRLVEGCDG